MRNKYVISAAAILAGMTFASSAVMANDKDDMWGDDRNITFSSVDSNGDGAISMTEANAYDGINFKEADQNGNGSLNKAEFHAAVDAYDEDDAGVWDMEDEGSQDRGAEGVGEEDEGVFDAEDEGVSDDADEEILNDEDEWND